jgi:hypothetical protein
MIDFTAQWLLSNIPTDFDTALVHGDFRNGNLMVTPDGIAAVLDWELCHMGDPMRDLGWLCVNSWRFGNRSLPVGGFGKVEDLIAGYESETGQQVDLATLRFWEVFGSFWWSVTTLSMANTWRSGETPSVERPVIGRRSSEAQMDCVHLLIPGELPAYPGKISEVNLPSVSEIISSVKSHLSEHVGEKLVGADQFLMRVAVNSLSIAEREISFAPAAERAELAGLKSLFSGLKGTEDLVQLRWNLVLALRSNEPMNIDVLSAHLRQTVAHRLYIDQPKYSALTNS